MADLVGRMLGEFVLREQIGEGGYAVVHRGEQPALKRDVVVKVLRTRRRLNDASRERFLREAQLASRLDHPYAAHVYAFGAEEDGLLWIALELVHGTTLGEWLDTHGPMPIEQFVPFFECVAEVVQAAHDRGIVHRDLKPSNVMVIERRGRLLPKLLDFGIAKVSEEEPEEASGEGDVATAQLRRKPRQVPRTRTGPRSYRLTRPGSGMGSSPYMAPEQWRNACAVGPAADVYSLGILAYEALTGDRPFNAENTDDYYRLHLYGEVPRLGGAFSPELERVLRQAMAKEPGDRQGSVLELAAQLRAAQRAQPGEQLRSLAQVWNDRARPRALLLKSGDLLRAPTGVIGELERAFVAASQRHVARSTRVRRIAVVSAAALVAGAGWYRAELKAELAEQNILAAQRLTEATLTHAELEQGRAALLHNEPEAQLHLAEAYHRDPLPSTGFMLARAMQPRLAEQARFPSSFGRMWYATFSPDGARVVTTDDKNAQLWDARTHRLLFTLPHGDAVYQATYSSDGTKLVTAAGDGAVRIWDARNGTLVRAFQVDRTRRYYAVAMSPDGGMVAAIDLKGVVAHAWDGRTGALLASIANDASGLPSIALSADGRWLATSGGNDVRVVDTRTWAQILKIPGPKIVSLSWDPSGPRLLTGSADGDASIWAIPSGARIHHLREIGEPIDAVAFSPDGRLVAAASRDGAEQVWNASTGKLQSQGNYLRGKILSVEFDPTSRLVVAAGTSGAVAVSDANQGMPIAVLEGPRNVVMVAHFNPRSTQVIGASWDGTARIWDATSPYRAWGAPPVHDNCGLMTSLEPDQRFLAVGCLGHPTRIWDTAHDRRLAELPSVPSINAGFASAYPAVSAAGDRAAIARGSTVEVYELPGGRLLRTVAHGGAVNTVAFAATGRDLVSGAADGSLLVARENGAVLVLPATPAAIDATGFLPDGRVVAADAQRRLRVFAQTGAVLASMDMRDRTRFLRMSPDSRRLITVPTFMGNAGSPELWDLERYRPIAHLSGQGQVFSARFLTPEQFVTASSDGAARLWDAATGALRQTYRGGARVLVDVTRSPDGTLIVGGGGDGMLRFWDARSGRPLWTMPAHRSPLVGIRVDGEDIITRAMSGEISRWRLPQPERVIDACSKHDSCAMVSR